MEVGGGCCSLCGAPGTNKTTCPFNPKAVNKDYMKHLQFDVQGAEGAEGAEGAQEPKGPKGAQEAKGPKGPTGAKGPKGPTEAKGIKGPKGDQGPKGPQLDRVVHVAQENLLSRFKISDLLSLRATNKTMRAEIDDYLTHLFRVYYGRNPIDLRELLYRSPPKAMTHELPPTLYNGYEYELSDAVRTAITVYVKAKIPTLHRGDAFYNDDATHTTLWDGETVVDMTGDGDTIPRSLPITSKEFSPYYWKELYRDAEITYLSGEITKNILFTIGRVPGLETDVIRGTFTIRGEKYFVVHRNLSMINKLKSLIGADMIIRGGVNRINEEFVDGVLDIKAVIVRMS
jgi:hypothetical protein